MLTAEDLVGLHRSVSRIVAHLAGSDPLIVWATYRTFEEDMCILADVMGVLEDSAKPYLEMREREYARPSATSPAASRRDQGVPSGSTEIRLDTDATK